MATQNPIEQEGTYPLPEAQLDRFMLSINIGYPTRNEERRIVMATTQAAGKRSGRCCRARTCSGFSSSSRGATSQHMVDYAVDLCGPRGPRSPEPGFRQELAGLGAGPRAAQYMILGAKARAIIHGRFAVSATTCAMAYPVLRHRIFTNFNADAEGMDVDQVIEKILQAVPEPSYGEPGGDGSPRKSTAAKAKQT